MQAGNGEKSRGAQTIRPTLRRLAAGPAAQNSISRASNTGPSTQVRR